VLVLLYQIMKDQELITRQVSRWLLLVLEIKQFPHRYFGKLAELGSWGWTVELQLRTNP
jgi:hypothetical protein